MKQIVLNSKTYNIPETWDELSRQQVLQVTEALFLKEYKAEQLLLKLLKIVTGAGYHHFFKWKAEEAEEYFYLLVFLLRPDFEYTKNNLGAYKHKNVVYHGPVDHMDNLRMKEFARTEDLFLRWHGSEKKDEEALNQLVAILYRPQRPDYDLETNPLNDVRLEYNYNACLAASRKTIAYWPLNVRLAIATWYDGCRRQLIGRYSDVFDGSGEPAQFGLVSVMLNVAESHVFGTFKEVEEQHVYLVLMQLSEVVARAKKLEAGK